jgi:sulfite reductase (NADPH) flavoprotein alpha-component
MLAEPRLKELQNWVASYSKEELIWINGYLSGLLAETKTTVAATNAVAKKITIAYGTETGNAQKLATTLAAQVKKTGLPAKLVSLEQYRLGDLEKEDYFFAIISTHGEGEPPIAAKKFYEHIHQNGFKVPQIKYGVLALGDSSYPLFCKTGEEVDSQLQHLGGTRVVPLQKCDVDYESPAAEWFNAVLQQLQQKETVAIAAPTVAPAIAKKPTTKKIYTGTILSNINLTAKGSTKKTYHIEIAAEAVDYQPGDSIAIVPENDAAVVEEILFRTQTDGAQTVQWKNESAPLYSLLREKIGISYLTEKAVQQYATLAQQTIAPQRADLLQLLRQYPLPVGISLGDALALLNPIAPRIYNIAAAPSAHAGEVHIIALQDVFEVDGQQQTGLCTRYFERLQAGDTIRFFVQPNKRFRLPAADKDIIMIGPGTGIAPFRSFVAERDATGATGRNWLFFAETDFTTDFYYQTEWQAWFNTDVLTKISLAFDNNHTGITTIQDKIKEQAHTLFEWLQNGAFLYLCGQKDPMSKEVEAALLEVIAQAGNMSASDAQQYFEQLKNEGRYMKDVY